jgi:hypothetical protein
MPEVGGADRIRFDTQVPVLIVGAGAAGLCAALAAKAVWPLMRIGQVNRGRVAVPIYSPPVARPCPAPLPLSGNGLLTATGLGRSAGPTSCSF